MKREALVSIIMPAYNSEKHIGKAIKSVIEQSYSNWELIVIDDCSTDATRSVISETKDPRIKLILLSQNSGAGEARNAGLAQAKGQLIAFLDADDVWLPLKLEKQVDYILKMDAAICHTSYSFINEEDKSIAGYVCASNSLNQNEYMRNTEIGLSTSMINKIKVGNFQFSSMRLRQDTRLWIELLGKNFIARGLNEVLVLYRIRKGQISGNKLKSIWRTFKLYMSIRELPLKGRLINFFFYLTNAISKRIKSV